MARDLVFCVSGGRTGTMFLGEVLQTVVEDCFSVHEPDLLGLRSWRDLPTMAGRIRTFGFRHMVVERLAGRSGARNLAVRWRNGAPTDDIVGAILRQRERYHRSVAAGLLVESNYQWVGCLPPLRTAFPAAKIVALVRDPRTWVGSYLNFGGHHDAADMVRRFGQRRLAPALMGENAMAEAWPRMSVFEKLCWDWRTVTRLLDAFCAEDGGARLYRYEDLFDPARTDLRADLLAFVTHHGRRRYAHGDLEAALGTRHNVSRPKTAHWTDWSPDRAVALDRLCGSEMRRHGYGHEPAWQAKLAAARRAAADPREAPARASA